MSVPWVTPAALSPSTTPAPDMVEMGAALSASVATMIGLADATGRRSLQRVIGASEIGIECDRQLAYKMTGTAAVNRPDPLRAIVGTALHMWLRQAYDRLDGGSGRFVTETRLEYRGIPGSADCYDRNLKMVIDWKSSTLKKIADLKRQGVPQTYVVQAHTYGAALAQRGEDVRFVALVFIPIDGTLQGIWSMVIPLDRGIADAGVDRVNTLRDVEPSTVACTPSRLCGWCGWYAPGATDLAVACPGKRDTNNGRTMAEPA
jgi:hypothetical protein